MSLVNLAKAQEEMKLSELDKIIKVIEEKHKQMEALAKAPLEFERARSKNRLDGIKSELKRQKINKDILKEILDMREENEGRALVGNSPVPVSPDAQGLPLLDSLANRR